MAPKRAFLRTDSIADLQRLNMLVYGIPTDRFYSLENQLTQVQRFAMRTLKGIRKGDATAIRHNLTISVSWLLSIANRIHIDVEEEVWKRFPSVCPYCASKTCICAAVKPTSRKKVTTIGKKKPSSLQAFQEMFRIMYPPEKRTLPDAGIHFAEEVGEVSEAIHNYLGQHIDKQFDEIKLEIADLISNMFATANSSGIDLSIEFEKMYRKGCHVCHKIPCTCSYTFIAKYK